MDDWSQHSSKICFSVFLVVFAKAVSQLQLSSLCMENDLERLDEAQHLQPLLPCWLVCMYVICILNSFLMKDYKRESKLTLDSLEFQCLCKHHRMKGAMVYVPPFCLHLPPNTVLGYIWLHNTHSSHQQKTRQNYLDEFKNHRGISSLSMESLMAE